MKVIGLICSGKNKDALKELGRALHTTQDFFSHSNFVDPTPASAACIPIPVLGLHLTSYDPSLLSSDPEEPDNDPEDYTHGSCAKDYPDKNGEAISFFHQAYDAAVQATANFVNAIKAEITSNGCPNSDGTVAWQHFLNGEDTAGDGGDDMISTFLNVGFVTAFDPNDKTGSQGIGIQQYISGATPLRYAVYFGNEDTATAPAQQVVITDQLDLTHDDRTTFGFGPIAFGDRLISPPPLQSHFSTTVDLRPSNNLLVTVTANLNSVTGLVTWKFTSLDPTTKQPPTDPTAGFLPPGGEGNVVFTVMPKQGLATNTQIQNQATIVFDVNPPINTPVWVNTLDNNLPTSYVLPLPATQTSPSFPVQWVGTDIGSGIQGFTIYVSDNGGPFTPFVTNTAVMSATYPGVAGHTYGFFSQARDLTGNVEALKTQAEATTTVTTAVTDTTPPTTTATPAPAPNTNGWNNTTVTVTLSAVDNPGGSGVKQLQFSLTGASSGMQTVPGSSAAIAIINEGVTTLTYFATDNAGNQEAPKTLTVQVDKTPPSVSCCSADGLWHASDVSIACTVSDSGSGLANAADANFTLSTTVPSDSETANAATNSHSVADLAGNAATAGPISGNQVDKKAPSITISAPTNTAYLLGSVVAASYTCADGGSGVASCIGTVANGANIITSSVGAKSFTVNAKDNVGTTGSMTVSYTVNYNFSGFFTPVSNPPVVNTLKAGGDITLKFSLGGNQGLTIFATNSPASQQMDCTSKAPSGSATPTNPLGSSGLSYTPQKQQYLYTWLTDKAWAGTCRQLLMTLNDGTQHIAYFQFTQ